MSHATNNVTQLQPADLVDICTAQNQLIAGGNPVVAQCIHYFIFIAIFILIFFVSPFLSTF